MGNPSSRKATPFPNAARRQPQGRPLPAHVMQTNLWPVLSGVGNGIAPSAVRMLRTHSPYPEASCRADASSGATTTSVGLPAR